MFKRILLPIDVDYPRTAAAVYQRAAEYAKLSGAEIKIVSVMPGFGMPIVASYIPEKVRRDAAAKFKAAVEKFINENCGGSIPFTIRTGKNWEEILKAAEEWDADLIVVYHNHRRDINEAFSGSCSRRVAEHAKCSVLRMRQIL